MYSAFYLMAAYINVFFRIPQSNDISDSWLPITDGKTRYLKIQVPSTTFIDGPMPFKSKLDNCVRLLSSPASKSEL